MSVYSLSVPGHTSKYLVTRLSVDGKKFSTATKELFKEKMSINYYQRITAKEVTEELSVHSLNCNRDLYLFLSLYTVFTIYGFFFSCIGVKFRASCILREGSTPQLHPMILSGFHLTRLPRPSLDQHCSLAGPETASTLPQLPASLEWQAWSPREHSPRPERDTKFNQCNWFF